MIETIRNLIAAYGRMPVDIATIPDNGDLYAAGLTSFSAVQLMLGIEEAFDIEFPERMLGRKTFASIDAIANAINQIHALNAAA